MAVVFVHLVGGSVDAGRKPVQASPLHSASATSLTLSVPCPSVDLGAEVLEVLEEHKHPSADQAPAFGQGIEQDSPQARVARS